MAYYEQYRELHNRTKIACDCCTSNTSSALASDIKTIKQSFSKLNLSSWTDEAGQGLAANITQLKAGIDAILSAIRGPFAASEKLYHMLDEELNKLKINDEKLTSKIASEPQQSKYLQKVTDENNEEKTTYPGYSEAHASWQSEKSALESECESSITRIETLKAGLESINDSGIDGGSYSTFMRNHGDIFPGDFLSNYQKGSGTEVFDESFWENVASSHDGWSYENGVLTFDIEDYYGVSVKGAKYNPQTGELTWNYNGKEVTATFYSMLIGGNGSVDLRNANRLVAYGGNGEHDSKGPLGINTINNGNKIGDITYGHNSNFYNCFLSAETDSPIVAIVPYTDSKNIDAYYEQGFVYDGSKIMLGMMDRACDASDTTVNVGYGYSTGTRTFWNNAYADGDNNPYQFNFIVDYYKNITTKRNVILDNMASDNRKTIYIGVYNSHDNYVSALFKKGDNERYDLSNVYFMGVLDGNNTRISRALASTNGHTIDYSSSNSRAIMRKHAIGQYILEDVIEYASILSMEDVPSSSILSFNPTHYE